MNKPNFLISELESGFCLGGWHVTPKRNAISRDAEEKHLENRLMRTLVYLAMHQGQVISREQFFESVWQGRVVNEEALSRAISLLRTALEDNTRTPRFIQTIPGIGYRLIAEVSIGSGQAVSMSTASDIPENSIAVLPFINLSDDPGNEYFSEGISEEILNSLAQVPSFRVVGRTSSFAFKNRIEDLREIGKILNVSHVLEGSIRKSGRKTRITAQLIKTADGFHLWSETFDRDLDDIFAVQDEIAAAVAGALKLRMLGVPHKVQETEPEAYSLYLQALFFYKFHALDSVEKALGLFKKATEVDPEYAPAWVGVAEAYWSLMSLGVFKKSDCIEPALNANSRALEIDPGLADAHVCMARLCASFQQDWETAQSAMNRAQQLAPGSAKVLLQAGHLASNIGNFEESVDLLKHALSLDPLYTTTHIWLSMSYIPLGRFQEAREILLRALNLNPERPVAHMLLGKILLLQGKYREGHKQMELEPEGFWRQFGLALSLHSLKRFEKADATLQAMIEAYTHEGPFQIAEIHGHRGQIDEAFHWLDIALDEHDNGLNELLVSPSLTALHGDPRWAAYVKKMGLKPKS